MQKEYKLLPEQYTEVLKGLELTDIKLIQSKTSLNIDSNSPEGIISVKHKDIKYKNTESCVLVYITWVVEGKTPKPSKPIINISATYLLAYTSKILFTDDFFEIFKDQSLPFTTLPFFREFANNTTIRMGITPLTLPLSIRL